MAVRDRALRAGDDLRKAADAPAGSGAVFDPQHLNGNGDMAGICHILYRTEEETGWSRHLWKGSIIKRGRAVTLAAKRRGLAAGW